MVSENKNHDNGDVKGTQEPTEEALSGQYWNNLTKKKQDSIRL